MVRQFWIYGYAKNATAYALSLAALQRAQMRAPVEGRLLMYGHGVMDTAGDASFLKPRLYPISLWGTHNVLMKHVHGTLAAHGT